MPTSADVYELGDVVRLAWEVRDASGVLTDPNAYALAITPDGGAAADLTGAVTRTSVGSLIADYTPVTAGWYSAVLTTTGMAAGAATTRFLVLDSAAAAITAAQLRAYLRGGTTATDAELLAVLEVERAAQARVCYTAPYPVELREALMRRVARNLAARAIPAASMSSFEAGGTLRPVLPSVDHEIERLEGPYRQIGIA